MSISDAVKNQFRAVITWADPEEYELFRRFDGRDDELKNASTLIIHPGQGCIFTREGAITDTFTEPGSYQLETDNRPFITTVKNFLNAFESEHKTGLWFFRTAEITNVRWGTRMPITYNDPVYSFPVRLRAYGNFSVKITRAAEFFTRIVAAKANYYAYELQELLLSRISQPIGQYLAGAKFSFAEIDGHLEQIAADAAEKTRKEFEELGFELLDFRIEGTAFDEETQQRIAGISDVQADVKAAQLAGVPFESLQKMLALREAARNEGGQGAQLITALHLNQPQAAPAAPSVADRLKTLKALFEEGLISEDEYTKKKQELMKEL